MFRVDSEDSVASLPVPEAVGTPGYYDKGNPGLGIESTVVPYDHLNAIQESIINPIEKRGIALSKASPYDKLTDAIMSFMAEAGNVSGLMLSLTSGVLEFKGSDGNTLSSSNFGYVPCKSATAGKKVALKMANPITLNDLASGSSDMTGIGLGLTEANNWGDRLPLFLYSISKSDLEIKDVDGFSAIGVSRNFCMHKTPSSGIIGKKGSAPSSDDERSIILLGDNYTTANYALLPCHLIGAITATWNGSSTDYTFESFTGAGTEADRGGLGEVALERIFGTSWQFPANQNGASGATSRIQANGGTAPIFSSQVYYYTIRRDGVIEAYFRLSGDGGTDGSGSVNTRVILPYTNRYGDQQNLDYVHVANSSGAFGDVMGEVGNGQPWVQLRRVSTVSVNTYIQHSSFGNGDRYIAGCVRYRAYSLG